MNTNLQGLLRCFTAALVESTPTDFSLMYANLDIVQRYSTIEAVDLATTNLYLVYANLYRLLRCFTAMAVIGLILAPYDLTLLSNNNLVAKY